MNRVRGFLISEFSRLVESNAREVALGDLAELKLGLWRSIWELCELIVKQQAPRWNTWRPWFSLLGIVGLVGVPLNARARSLAFVPWMNIRAWSHGSGYQRGLTAKEEIIIWLSLAVAILLWSWAAGFAFTALSRTTAPVTGILLGVGWLCWNIFLIVRSLLVLPWFFLFLWLIPAFLFLPALSGAKRAFRSPELTSGQAIVLLVVTLVMIVLVTWTSGWPEAIESWSGGAIHGGVQWYRRLLPYLWFSWPTVWILATSRYHGKAFYSKGTPGNSQR